MKVKVENVVITKTKYKFGKDEIIVEIVNTIKEFKWRMIVNDDASEWDGYYQGILFHKGYGLVTAYWEGTFIEFVPFKVRYAKKAK